MKPEEYLMQHYRYWTIPDLGLSEDEKGYVDALRIGAEAIEKVEKLSAEMVDAVIFTMVDAVIFTCAIASALGWGHDAPKSGMADGERFDVAIRRIRKELEDARAEVERLRAENEQLQNDKVLTLHGYEQAKQCIAGLEAERTVMLDQIVRQQERITEREDRLFREGGMEEPPCFLCGYNGPGYFDPTQHPCAERHHRLAAGAITTLTKETES